VAGRVAPPPPDAAQLPLFAPEHPVLKALQALDPNTLTPLEALSRLAELKRRAEEL
jgi:DNA mismatch repair protein MutS